MSASSGWSFRLIAFGGSALKPASSCGVTTMKMISSTSMTSIIGVTLGVACIPPATTTGHCHLLSPVQADYVEIGPVPLAALNSRVKRERPNSPETPLMR